MHSPILLPSTFFLSALQWIPFEGAPIALQQAAARREFWDFDAALLKEIFLDAAGLQLNSAKFLSTLDFSQLHCSSDDLNCTALNHIWVHCNMLHMFQILFYIL